MLSIKYPFGYTEFTAKRCIKVENKFSMIIKRQQNERKTNLIWLGLPVGFDV